MSKFNEYLEAAKEKEEQLASKEAMDKDPEYFKKYKVGGKMVVFAGAPGIGKTVYTITRIDDSGMFGKRESSNVRILDPEETR